MSPGVQTDLCCVTAGTQVLIQLGTVIFWYYLQWHVFHKMVCWTNVFVYCVKIILIYSNADFCAGRDLIIGPTLVLSLL